MQTYKVDYELIYPDANDDFKVAYVLASDFSEAQRKVELRYKTQYEKANVKKR